MRKIGFATVALFGMCSGVSLAAGPNIASLETAPEFQKAVSVDYLTGQTISASVAPRAGGVIVYDNTSSGANAGISSTDLATTWGDELIMTAGGGPLTSFTFTLFNSGTNNSGNLVSANVDIDFYRASDSSSIGGFSGTLDFGTDPLGPGFYTLLTFENLDSLGISFDTNDIIVTQVLSNVAGGTTRMGVVSLSPVVIGSSPTDFYKDDPSSPPAGFYTAGATPVQLGYQVEVPEPVTLSLLALSGLSLLRRRR